MEDAARASCAEAMNRQVDMQRRVLDGTVPREQSSLEIDHQKIACPHLRPVKAERHEQKPVLMTRHHQGEVIIDALVETEMRRQAIAGCQIDPRLPLTACDGFGTPRGGGSQVSIHAAKTLALPGNLRERAAMPMLEEEPR